MLTVYERHTLTATLILDLEDSFARDRLSGHPRPGERSRPGGHPRPAEPLRFFMIEQNLGGAVTKFDPAIELEVIRNASGFHIFFGRQKLRGARGEISTRALELPPGKYTLRVTSPFYQAAQKIFDLPIGNANDPNVISKYQIDMEPSFAYPFPDVYPLGQLPAGNCTTRRFTPKHGTTLLRGSILDTGGSGLAAARVGVTNKNHTYTTDESGQWVLWFDNNQPTGLVSVTIEAPDGSVQQVDNVCVVQGYETSLYQTALRGWVRRGGQPVAGAVITVQNVDGQSISDKSGSWTFAFPFSQAAEAVTLNAAVPGLPPQTRTVMLVRRATVVVDPFQF